MQKGDALTYPPGFPSFIKALACLNCAAQNAPRQAPGGGTASATAAQAPINAALYFTMTISLSARPSRTGIKRNASDQSHLRRLRKKHLPQRGVKGLESARRDYILIS